MALTANAVTLLTGTLSGWGQTYTVTNSQSSGAGSLSYGVVQANVGMFDVIELPSGLSPIMGTEQMFVNANVTINGNGNVINMQNLDRAFFVAGGTVNVSNLTIQNGNAQGGAGSDGGGGGLGAGGGIFVANGVGIFGSGVTLATNVTLSNVSFLNNSAVGGSGAGSGPNGLGGGGGMGGAGGEGYVDGVDSSGGAGGGFGINAYGGAGSEYGNGGGPGAFACSLGGSGSGGWGGAPGAYFGGGGGGGNDGLYFQGGGGGGGVGGGNADGDTGGNGGFGGGGGGCGQNNAINSGGGNGGFGGGGGGAGGNGGFGGGGGGNAGTGGFGAGTAYVNVPPMNDATIGGGGAGLGGAIFVQDGATLTVEQAGTGTTFLGNSSAGGLAGQDPGQSAADGSAIGQDMFLGGDVTFNVAGTLSLNGLGGAGDLDDVNVSRNANDPNAQGGIIMAGTGTLQLTGTSYYTGETVINNGTVSLAAGAKEQGTTSITVGGETGNGTLLLGNGSILNMGGTEQVITLGSSANNTGTVVISTGGAGVTLGVSTITGGVGGGTVIFDEVDGVSGDGPYPMFTQMTGNLSVEQNGQGTTILSPFAQYGPNTYTGGTTINSGVVQVGSGSTIAQGLPSEGAVTVNGGTLDINGRTITVGVLSVNGGVIEDSAGGGAITPSQVLVMSGSINVSLDGDIELVKSGSGTAHLTQANTYNGGTSITGGALVVSSNQGLGDGVVTVSSGTLSLQGGEALTNLIELSGGMYAVEVIEGGGYAGMVEASSNLAHDRNTSASLLAGTSSWDTTLQTSFAAICGASNDSVRASDVYSFVGTGEDVFVMELSMSVLATGSELGWLNLETNAWENAVNGNVNPTASAGQQGFAGSFASFQAIHGTDLGGYVGAYGMDEDGGAVWAVLNHNGDFSVLVVPEPGSASLLLGGLSVLCWKLRKRNRNN